MASGRPLFIVAYVAETVGDKPAIGPDEGCGQFAIVPNGIIAGVLLLNSDSGGGTGVVGCDHCPPGEVAFGIVQAPCLPTPLQHTLLVILFSCERAVSIISACMT